MVWHVGLEDLGMVDRKIEDLINPIIR